MNKGPKSITKYLIYIGIFLAILVLIIIFGILPQYHNFVNNQKTLAQTKAELNSTAKKRVALEELSKDQTKIDLIKQTTSEYLPQNPENSDFVVKVEALAKELSITIKTFAFIEEKTKTPAKTDTSESENGTKTAKESSATNSADTGKTTKPKAEPKNYSEFSIDFSAEYGATTQFLEKMESFPRVNSITSINISSYDPNTSTSGLRITGRIFYGQ